MSKCKALNPEQARLLSKLRGEREFSKNSSSLNSVGCLHLPSSQVYAIKQKNPTESLPKQILGQVWYNSGFKGTW